MDQDAEGREILGKLHLPGAYGHPSSWCRGTPPRIGFFLAIHPEAKPPVLPAVLVHPQIKPVAIGQLHQLLALAGGGSALDVLQDVLHRGNSVASEPVATELPRYRPGFNRADLGRSGQQST